MAIAIGIEAVTREFGPVRAVDDVTLSIGAGEFFTLLGSSGCGKSTLLKLIGGFDQPTAGRITFDGRDMAGIPANRRPVNTVFQGLGLFPHMSVAKNVGYGLSLRGLSGKALAVKVEDALDLVELSGFGPRDVNLLSGGQRQRVALARALVMEPGILLLDEPLTGLDERLRQQMRDEFARLHKRTGATFILVTHNQDEALSLSDRMAVMHQGRLQQIDRPALFFDQPANAFVARFVGIDIQLKHQGVTGHGEAAYALICGQKVPVRIGGPVAPSQTVVALRPDRLFLQSEDEISLQEHADRMMLTMVESRFRGLHHDVTLAFADGQTVVVTQAADRPVPEPGQTVAVTIAAGGAMLIPTADP
ncbi:ABC transporter ATP-binding protein [Rhizobium sp. SGZ-381]|uniref:ABC transporter ATP-binding protein n=1 Tax=Rhizobium sp. SGZ-381 TaxID=3342800 RepID=UPI00366B9F6E